MKSTAALHRQGETVVSAVQGSVSGPFTAHSQQLALAQGSSIHVWEWRGQQAHLAAVRHNAAIESPLLLGQVSLCSLQPGSLDTIICLSADGCLEAISWDTASWRSCRLAMIPEQTCTLSLALNRDIPAASHAFILVMGCKSGTLICMELSYDPSRPHQDTANASTWQVTWSSQYQLQTGDGIKCANLAAGKRDGGLTRVQTCQNCATKIVCHMLLLVDFVFVKGRRPKGPLIPWKWKALLAICSILALANGFPTLPALHVVPCTWTLGRIYALICPTAALTE